MWRASNFSFLSFSSTPFLFKNETFKDVTSIRCSNYNFLFEFVRSKSTSFEEILGSSKFLRESVRENKSRILSKFGNSNWAETTCKLLVSVFNFNPYPGVDNFLEYPWIIPPQVPEHRANIQSKSINNDLPRSILTSNPSNYPRIIHFWNSWSLERISITNNPPRRWKSIDQSVHPSLVILPSIAFYKSTINRARRDAWPRVERNESREIRGVVARSGVGERECRRSRAIYSNAGVSGVNAGTLHSTRAGACVRMHIISEGGEGGREERGRAGKEARMRRAEGKKWTGRKFF